MVNTHGLRTIRLNENNNINIVMTSNFFNELNPFGLEGWYSILRGLNA
jgi:hypothetical protein